MAINFAAVLFSEPELAGTLQIVGLGTGQRYSIVSADDLKSASLYHKVQSVELFASNTAESHIILFANDDFSGTFMQLTDNISTVDTVFEITEGKTGSALLVASCDAGKKETRVSMVGDFLGLWNDFITTALVGKPVTKKGEPTFTWEMFPQNINGLDPNSFYLKVYQPLHVSIAHWPDYSASLTYYIFLGIQQGEVIAQGVLATTWVESGLKHSKVYKSLNPEVQDGLSELQIKLDFFFLGLNSKNTYSNVYLLPGNQPFDLGGGMIVGNTNDDVTIVLEQSS